MNPHAERALESVLSIYGGEPWHGYSLTKLLEGLTAADAAERPAPGVHSIWELVLHVAAWTGEVASRLSGGEAGDPREGDWPPVGEPSPARWQAALQALDDAQRTLATIVRGVDDARWNAPVNDNREPPYGTGITYLRTLEGLAAHHAYHSGQIGMLKRWLEG
jgi:hypothetical protein